MSAGPTYYQRHVLTHLANDGERSQWGWGSSGINPTGRALERRGLARYEYDRSVAYPWGRWLITDAGLRAIGLAPTDPADGAPLRVSPIGEGDEK